MRGFFFICVILSEGLKAEVEESFKILRLAYARSG